jgi:tyrosyl-tRNA synthetase
MKVTFDSALHSAYPGYRMYTVVATDIDNTGEDSALEKLVASAYEAIGADDALASVASVADHPRIKAWRDAFEAFGADMSLMRPSVEGLAQRAREGKAIPFINKVVAISNYISLKYLVPSGGDDLAKIDGDFGLRYASGMERFIPIGTQSEDPPRPLEVVYADEQKVLCRGWIWRQCELSKITADSKHVVVNVDVLPPATIEEGLRAAEELAALIEKHCGGTTEIIYVGEDQQTAVIEPRVVGIVTQERLRDDSIRRLLDKMGGELSSSSDVAEWSIVDLMHRGNVEAIVVEHELVPRLAKGEKISIYQGFDPTSPNMHIGHLVSLRVLRWFQLCGHRVIFLIGDATAMIGDPSGRSEMREMLTPEQVLENMATYKAQAGALLDYSEDGANPVEVKQNSAWLMDLSVKDLLQLMSHVTAQRLLERDMFQARIKKGEPLFYVETIYPLMQGYDSVAMEVDAELGGRDQYFNMLMGRDLSRIYLGKDKHVLTTPLLVGFDGRKMSKTYGNTVDLTATPFDLFDGVMRVNDDLILTYARLLTDISWPELARMEASLADDPIAVKEEVALALVTLLRGADEAAAAHKEFTKVRRKGKLPEDIPVVFVPGEPADGLLVDFLAAAEPRVAKSKGELRRLIQQGGVVLAGNRIEDKEMVVKAASLDGEILQIGKKRFFKLTVD